MTQPEVTVRIDVRAPFDGRALLGFLAARAVPGVEAVRGLSYRRSLRLPRGPGTVRLHFSDADDIPSVTADFRLSDPADVAVAIVRMRHLLDAQAEPERINQVLAADPALSGAVARHPGLRLPGAVDGPEILLRALMGQQISVAAARTALGRLAIRAGHTLPDGLLDGNGPLTHLFPSSEELAELEPEDIPGPARRARAIITSARAITAGELIIDADRDPQALETDLLARPGIGPWTAGYVAMRVLADSDVLLAGDLVLRQGAAALGLPTDPPGLTGYAERWRPYRSYAGLHLWLTAADRPHAPRSPPGRQVRTGR